MRSAIYSRCCCAAPLRGAELRNRIRSQREPAEAAGAYLPGRGGGRGHQLQGQYLRLHADRRQFRAAWGRRALFTHGGSRLFEFDRSGKFVREIGQGVYGFLFAQAVRVDPQDNIWVVDRGSNMVIKFNSGRARGDDAEPEAGVAWPGGRRRPRRRAKHRGGDSGRQFQPADRRGMGRGGEYLRRRWLRQRTHRQDGQERQVPQVVGHEGIRSGAVQYSALAGDGRAGQRVRGRPREPADSGFRQRGERSRSQITGRRHSLGDLYFARVRTSTSSAPTPTIRATWRTGKSTSWSWTGRSSASSGGPASCQRSSAR